MQPYPYRTSRRLFNHEVFFGPLGIRLRVWSELGRSPPFQPMGALRFQWSWAFSLACEVALNQPKNNPAPFTKKLVSNNSSSYSNQTQSSCYNRNSSKSSEIEPNCTGNRVILKNNTISTHCKFLALFSTSGALWKMFQIVSQFQQKQSLTY